MRSILLLKGLNQRLPLVEKFLESRGFKITVVHRICDAIYFITENRPDFALFSTELIPTESVWLFDILKQLTSVVLFAERISAKSLGASKDLKGHYLLEPPLTPLGFEQLLRRIDHDQRPLAKNVPNLDMTHVLIMSTLSDLALKALCIPAPQGNAVEPVRKISRVTSFRVETKRLSGFFVFAYGKDRTFEPKWLGNMQAELKKYLGAFDAESSLDSPDETLIAEVQFPDWSKEQADFIHEATHNDAELALAFFKDPTQLSAQASLRPDHVEIGINHLRGDSVVNFDVYVYLPENARFVLYTPQGGTFYESQKKKLISEGLNTVHIHKRSFDELRKQRTREFLEESTAGFHSL
jgi:hypothetical protein